MPARATGEDPLDPTEDHVEDDGSKSQEDAEVEDQEPAAAEPWQSVEEDREAAEDLLRASQMRMECVKVCAPAQLAELVEGAQNGLARVYAVKSAQGLRRLRPTAIAEHASLVQQWQQRSGTIRVVVRVRPAHTSPGSQGMDDEEAAVKVIAGGARPRALTLSVPRRGGRSSFEEHSFKRFDYLLSSEKDQEATFRELKAMLPSAGPGGLSGPPQSACILAYGQTGSGKTHTMQGADGKDQGLVPRVLLEIFHLAADSGATVSLSALEIYNDIAYDLLDGAGTSGPSAPTAAERAGEDGGRAFSVGRLPPPPGLDFRHGCQSALGKATSITVSTIEDAQTLLARAAERRSTRSTCFNASSSRSHSLVLVHAHLPDSAIDEPALRLAFVDLAGSERLPAAEAGGPVAEESRHINLSLSSLGSVIHALRHRANHLPYRACLLTRLLEPFFKSTGRVLLCVCVSPERRHAQETLCSLAFADRASRAVLGAESAQEVQRSQALGAVREAHAIMRSVLRALLPKSGLAGTPTRQRLPDWLAADILAFMPEHGEAAFVCRAWAELCKSHKPWGRELRRSKRLAGCVLQFLQPQDAAGVCKTWWKVAGAYQVVMEAGSAKVCEAAASSVLSKGVWAPASARTRAEIWKALLTAGGGSGAVGSPPLSNVRECVLAGAPRPEALRQVLLRCPELRVADISEPSLVSAACAGLSKCLKLRALKCSLTLVPNIANLGDVLKSCKRLRVLNLSNTADFPVSMQYLTEELPKNCSLKELTVLRCTAGWREVEKLCKCCTRLQRLRIPQSFIEAGETAMSPPPLLPLARLKQLRYVDFTGHASRAHKHRPWLTDDMFGILGQVRELREVRADHQKLLSDRCFWFLRRHSARLRVLHLSGCRPMVGESAFGLLHLCESMESIRLPTLVVGQSERKLGVVGTHRWCQGLRCPRLRELCVEGWPSLEDSGVQMLSSQCPFLRIVWLRQAPKLSDDAVTYLAGMQQLSSLSLACAAGLTDRSLQEFASSPSKLRCLDLSGCRQLTEAGVVEFAASIAKADGGPHLRSLQLDLCANLGRAAAEALAACPGLLRCSLSSCRPMPEAASAWQDAEGKAKACQALGLEVPEYNERLDGDDAVAVAPASFEQPPPAEETAQCAICMDDITADDAVWECPVCCNKLHDTEECARGWLRLRQSCPTCRAAAWAPPPPEAPPASNPFRPLQLPPRRRPARALSADAGLMTPTAPVAVHSPPSLPDISVAGMNMQASQVQRQRPPSAPTASEDWHPRAALQEGPPAARARRRPPRPAASAPAAPSPAGRLQAVLNRGLPQQSCRARSLPPRRGAEPSGGLALAGLSIVGSASRS
eukprot:TRINITY_DN93231_c0_g1_i1.p1 TRINITY_DN93231_c0_g1~~TRINITY_DN93231_c0_g1_i1.p1  ORF type:complete len:1347 (-),score=246.20 TRINITY_DN93231_c0_g1_i1:47-4087(-)